MPKTVRTKKQVRSDKHALRVLRDKQLFRGKIDLRKPPSRAQKRAIAKFADVITGKASVVKPAKAKDYRGVLKEITGGRFIVPKKKGERVRVVKGEIVSERKTKAGQIIRRRRIKSAGRRRKRKNVRYGIPFNRAGAEVTIQWFPTMKALRDFMQEYEYKDWQDYVIEDDYSGEEFDEE